MARSDLERLSWLRPSGSGPRARPVVPAREPAVVFAPDLRELAAVELCVNFGLLAGREVSAAEVEQLAVQLLMRVARVSVVSELGEGGGGAVHQLRIQVMPGAVGFEQHDLAELRGRLMEITERWLAACLAAHTRELNAA
jgi:hypothetical protein